MMCALQECSSTPLLPNKIVMATSTNFKSKESLILCTEPVVPSYAEQFTKNTLAEGELFSHVSDIPPENISPAFDEKPHLQSKNVFQIQKNSRNTYSELNPMPGEIDHLLCDEYADRPCCVREAEFAIPHGAKKVLSKRSASDYSLSKKYDEVKTSLPVNPVIDIRQNVKSTIHPLAEVQHSASNIADGYMPNDSNYYGVLEEEIHMPSFGKRNSLPMDCEPSGSGLYQNNLKLSDDRNFYKGYNLNPTVNLKIFDTESLSESGDLSNNGLATDVNSQRILDEAWFITSSRHTFSGAELSGSASAAQLSIASSFGDSNTPTCKICHMPAKTDDPLISPCRCTGTLHYIHCGCLMRWLEICNKRSRKPPACELCKYQFHWHKKFKVRHWQFPNCSWRDKILHTVFLISILVMIGCAIVTVMCFRQHRGNKPDLTHLELTQSEIITLICGALFFLAFFLAMYVEIKARNTIYKLLVKFIYLNQQWYIDEYDKKGENTVIDV